MRLIAKRAEKQARRDRATVDAERPRSEQPRREKCILSQAECPKHGGKCQYWDERGKTALAENSAHNDQINSKGRHLEDQERHEIRQTGDESTKQQENRWVVKEPILDTRCGCLFFGSIVRGLVVGEFGCTRVGQASGRIEANEIGARGGVERHD